MSKLHQYDTSEAVFFFKLQNETQMWMNKVVLLKRHHKNVTMVVINYTNSKTINLSPPLTASAIWLVSPQSISICLSKNSPLNRHSFLLDGKYFYDSIHSLTTSSQILRLSIFQSKILPWRRRLYWWSNLYGEPQLDGSSSSRGELLDLNRFQTCKQHKHFLWSTHIPIHERSILKTNSISIWDPNGQPIK